MQSCGSSKLTMRLPKNTLLTGKTHITLEDHKNQKLKFTELSKAETISHNTLSEQVLENIKQTLYINENTLAALVSEKGIYFFNTKTGEITGKILVEKLADSDTRNMFLYEFGGKKTLFITFNTATGAGISYCDLSAMGEEVDFQCDVYNTENSELASNLVNQVTSDIKGNIWFLYHYIEGKGISRLSVDGKWFRFDEYNSELSSSEIYLVLPEKENEGLPEDNIWFVSGDGLSRLVYKEDAEIWKFYGDKKGVTEGLARIMGIEEWFTDAIINITDVKILPNSLAISNKNTVLSDYRKFYRFLTFWFFLPGCSYTHV